MTWINQVEDPKKEILYSVYWSKSGKGLILNTLVYSCFLWKDNKITPYLVNALNTYAQQGKNQVIQIIPNKQSKEGFTIEPVNAKSNSTDYFWYVVSTGWIYGKKLEISDPFGLM